MPYFTLSIRHLPQRNEEGSPDLRSSKFPLKKTRVNFGNIWKNINQTPELVVSTLPDCRNRGLGTLLISIFIDEIKSSYSGVSLSVRENNPAIKNLARRVGAD